ncbi:hypothetical protein DIPPA_26548 [Diplonema papillatum]|nr:hypothetical protein DIPPA_26548 [Diplonema papillatum]
MRVRLEDLTDDQEEVADDSGGAGRKHDEEKEHPSTGDDANEDPNAADENEEKKPQKRKHRKKKRSEEEHQATGEADAAREESDAAGEHEEKKPQKKKHKKKKKKNPDEEHPSTGEADSDAVVESEETKPPKKKHKKKKKTGEEKPGVEVFDSLEDRIRGTVQPTCHFSRLAKSDVHACANPDGVPEGYEDLLEETGCDMFKVPFDGAEDKRCLSLISDSRNWIDIKPMKQQLTERTIKFKAHFKDPRLRAIIKVPQKLFPYEAMSEAGSYYADRLMQTNRVPPTAWTHVPVKRIKEVVEKHGSKFEMVPLFMKDSDVTNYAEWIEKDLFKYARRRKLTSHEDPDFPDEEVLGVSVQLFIADVRPLLHSDLAIPWVPHNDSWQRHLSPSSPWAPEHAPGFVRQSELAMFDFVLGNGDRSPNKNNFVVGACPHHHSIEKCGSGPRHPGLPSFVTLDNGLMFFYELIPGRSPDGPNPLLKKTFCVFERKLLARLQEIADLGFSKLMQDAMPRSLKKYVTPKLLQQCEERLHKLLEQYAKCVDHFGEEKVIVA